MSLAPLAQKFGLLGVLWYKSGSPPTWPTCPCLVHHGPMAASKILMPAHLYTSLSSKSFSAIFCFLPSFQTFSIPSEPRCGGKVPVYSSLAEVRRREDGGSRESAKQGRESLVGGQRRKKGTTYNGNGIEKLKSRRGDKGQLRQPTK